MRLCRKPTVGRLAAIADHRPDDKPFNKEEDDGSDHEDEVVEVADQDRLIGGRVREADRLTSARHEGNGGKEYECR